MHETPSSVGSTARGAVGNARRELDYNSTHREKNQEILQHFRSLRSYAAGQRSAGQPLSLSYIVCSCQQVIFFQALRQEQFG
jgi:hypothetical protein